MYGLRLGPNSLGYNSSGHALPLEALTELQWNCFCLSSVPLPAQSQSEKTCCQPFLYCIRDQPLTP